MFNVDFWKDASGCFSWDAPFKRVCDKPREGSCRWFPGGRLHYSFNILDRNIQRGFGGKEILIVYRRDGSVRRYTYAALLERVKKLSFFLQAGGIDKDSKVLILLANEDKELSILLSLALQRLGTMFGFLYTRLPQHLIQYYLRTTQADVLICDPQVNPGFGSRDIRLLEKKAIIQGMDGEAWEGGASCDAADPRFWVFTSGTTSKPKIIETGHAGFLLSLIVFEKAFLAAAVEPLSLLVSLHCAFGPTVGLYHSVLFLGIRVVVCEEQEYLSTGKLADVITREKIDGIAMAPAFLDAMVHGSQRPLKLIFTGDKISEEQWRRCCRLFPASMAVNVYGQAETMGCLCSSPVPADPAHFRAVNALQAFPGVRYVLRNRDSEGRGQLWIHNSLLSLCRGYRGNRKDFLGRFNKNFSYFNTNDIAREEGGRVEIIGRNDNLIKIRSRYLEPALIEKEAKSVGGIHNAKVICRNGKIYLFAAGNAETKAALVERIRTRVGSYAVPARIFFFDSLPVGETGKVMEAKLCEYLNAT